MTAGVLLLLAIAALVYVVVARVAPTSDRAPTPFTASEAKPAGEAIVGELPLPAGAAIVDLATEGERILLLLRTPTGETYLAVVDAASGARRLLLRVVPERR